MFLNLWGNCVFALSMFEYFDAHQTLFMADVIGYANEGARKPPNIEQREIMNTCVMV